MQCRTKPPLPQKKNIHPATPKRGGVLYWFYIILCSFIVPMIVIPTAACILINVIFYPISPFVILGMVLISPLIAFFIARKAHRCLMQLPDDQYEACFNTTDVNSHKNISDQDEDDPYNPTSIRYWTIEPGSARYRNR